MDTPDIHQPCNVTLPAWPRDRVCTLPPGHAGDHHDGSNPGRVWTTEHALKVQELVMNAAATIMSRAHELARESVLNGTASLSFKGLENRAQHRAQHARPGKGRKAPKARDARRAR